MKTFNLSLNPSSLLKIYSFLPSSSRFRLTNGQLTIPHNSFALIGRNHFTVKRNPIEATRLLLSVLRPLPEILVVSDAENKNDWQALSSQFGCNLEICGNPSTAANMFNTLIDDNRRVIFISRECERD